MYPLIQTHVWARMGEEPELIKKVLDQFIKVSVYDVMYALRHTHTHTHTHTHVHIHIAGNNRWYWKQEARCLG